MSLPLSSIKVILHRTRETPFRTTTLASFNRSQPLSYYCLSPSSPVDHKVRGQNQHHRQSSSSSTTGFSSWFRNPFAQTGFRDTTSQLGSQQLSPGSADRIDEDHPRKLQERKDVTLLLLALEFYNVSSQHPTLPREERVDQAFQRWEALDVDEKSLLQLRHAMQSALEPQVIKLMQWFGEIDDELWYLQAQQQEGKESSSIEGIDRLQNQSQIEDYCVEVLQTELERTVNQLDNPTPIKAEKGADPKTFLTLKRGALERLLEKGNKNPVKSTKDISNSVEASPSSFPQPVISWNDADEFGYHESPVDVERNGLIRYYQAINLFRAAKLRNKCGYAVVALQSSIPGAGRGVYVDGYAKAGSVLAFQPGQVWSKEHLLNVSAEEERELERNDAYQMSLRHDDYMIDSRKSPYTVLTDEHSNLMAIGHIVNHPTPSNPPNARSAMFNFTQGMELGNKLKQRYIPNTYARPHNYSLMNSLYERSTDVTEMHSMVLVATRDICNEEVFYDYRLATSHYPQWYHRVQDTAFVGNKDDDSDNNSTHSE